MKKPIIISESTDEPISVAQAASNIQADEDDNSPAGFFGQEDIARWITTARKACEQRLEVSLVQKTLEVAQNGWWSPEMCLPAIELPYGPVRSIVSVKYTDPDGNEQTLAEDQYRFSAYDRVSMLIPAYRVSWPSLRCDMDSVRVRYEVGYPSEDSPAQTVPEPILQAMHLLIAHYNKNRDAVDDSRLAELPLGVAALLAPYMERLGV